MLCIFQRLNSLLFTTDLDVLILALNLLLRPSQQYSAQPSVSHALNISTPRLLSLAKRFNNLREYGITLVELITPKGQDKVDGLPNDTREVNFSYYPPSGSSARKEEKPAAQPEPSTFETPRKPTVSFAAPTPSSTAVNIHIDQETLQSKSPAQLLQDTLATHNLSDQDKFELMSRIRSAVSLGVGSHHLTERDKLVTVRLLATAIFGHTHNESQAQSSLLLYEPDLVSHIAELLQLDQGIPVLVQTAAAAALDALARYRNKTQEVLTAVNAGVNHGILMALYKRTIAEVADPNSTLPHSFVDALLSFVTYLSSHQTGGTMLVGAGLIPLLIQTLEVRLPHRLPVMSKTLQLLDNILYNFANAFQLFCNAHGVDILVDRIQVCHSNDEMVTHSD
jgi:E3 ubiquitin-protein ligase HUWE1